MGAESVGPAAFNLQNLWGQALLFRCLETGFVTTAPALTRYQKTRGGAIQHEKNWFVSVLPTWSRGCPQRPVSTAEWKSRGTSGHSGNTSSPRVVKHPE